MAGDRNILNLTSSIALRDGIIKKRALDGVGLGVRCHMSAPPAIETCTLCAVGGSWRNSRGNPLPAHGAPAVGFREYQIGNPWNFAYRVTFGNRKDLLARLYKSACVIVVKVSNLPQLPETNRTGCFWYGMAVCGQEMTPCRRKHYSQE